MAKPEAPETVLSPACICSFFLSPTWHLPALTNGACYVLGSISFHLALLFRAGRQGRRIGVHDAIVT
jgi:hypothetical protein